MIQFTRRQKSLIIAVIVKHVRARQVCTHTFVRCEIRAPSSVSQNHLLCYVYVQACHVLCILSTRADLKFKIIHAIPQLSKFLIDLVCGTHVNWAIPYKLCPPQQRNPQVIRGGRNRSFQYGNMRCCRWQSATVNIVRIAVLFENKVHLKLFKEGFPAKIILRIGFKQILNFFYLQF